MGPLMDQILSTLFPPRVRSDTDLDRRRESSTTERRNSHSPPQRKRKLVWRRIKKKKKGGEQAKQSSRKEKQQCDLGRGEQRATASPYQAQRCFSIFWFIGLGRPTMTRSQVLARLWLRARRLDAPPQAAGFLANCRESFKSQRLRGGQESSCPAYRLIPMLPRPRFLPGAHKAGEGAMPVSNVWFNV